ncbi:MAG TPA: excinuclease ABC subunit C [Oribacterium sp.]|nr:excinuclease ABC subunit C [Oribacterium sp.]
MRDNSRFNIQEELQKLPAMPGVYLMHGPKDEVIYVGKAKILKNRVKQYFQKSYKKSVKIQQMVSLVERFEYIVVDSELEALMLENNLIKEYKPRYNTLLKDDKTYPYIKVTNEAYPRVMKVRKRYTDKAKYFGPYASNEQVNEVIDLIRKTFRIRNCDKSFTPDHPAMNKCMYYDIHQCDAPCIQKITQEDYRIQVEKAIDFLNGKYEDIVKELTRKMMRASDNMDFETAIEMRDLIRSIEAVQNRQKIIAYDSEDRDIIGMRREWSDCIIQIFYVRDGKIIGRDHQFVDIDREETDEDILTEFIKQYYDGTPFVPKEIFVQKELPEKDILEQWLSQEKGKKVHIVTPQIGKKEKLVELAITNAGILMNRYRQQYREEDQKALRALHELQDIIGMEELPRRIESYDISNTSGVLNVGSMVVYQNGKAKNSDYRKFRIQSVQGADDYGSMKEMLTRRFEHGLREMRENADAGKDNAAGSFSNFPDLICMDGGKGQVNVCEEVLRDLGITSVIVTGMIKDDHHRTRALLYQNRELPVDEHSEAFKLLTRIQDEVHRFAIEYHRSLRAKNQIRSLLDDIKGVGAVRKKALMKQFGDIDHIRVASVEDLSRCPSMDEYTARQVYDFFHNNPDTAIGTFKVDGNQKNGKD